MRFLAILAICLWQIVLSVRADGQYSVIAPGTLHPAHKYNVAVALHQATQPCQLKIGLIGPGYEDSKIVDLQTNEVKSVEFDVPKLKSDGAYNLTAEGVSGIIFKNTTKLNLAEFAPYTKIQTDKGMYKPGDVVNFRVLFLDENLLPAEPPSNALIWFEDGKRNRVKEYKNITVVKGVYTGKFQLSEFPVLGYWSIYVRSGNQYDTQASIEVLKYTLPKYNVKIETTEKVAVQDGDMQVVVRSNYTYGKPVDGKVTLLLELQGGYYPMERSNNAEDDDVPKTPPTLIHTANMVNGKAKFNLNVKEYETFMTYKGGPTTLQLTATVEENFTGVKLNGTAHNLLYPYRYAMHCVSYESCSIFHADTVTEVVLQVMLIDGTQINDTKSVVKLTYTEGIRKFHWWRGDPDQPKTVETVEPINENKTYIFESHLNGTGFAIFKVSLPDLDEIKGYMHYYDIHLEYAGEKRQISTTYPYRKPKNIEPTPSDYEEPKDYFTLKPDYGKDKYTVKLGEEATIELNSSVPLKQFFYTIIGRGNVLQSELVELPTEVKVYELKFKTTFMMAPYAGVYVYYVDKHGEYHYAETICQVNMELQNQIEVTAPAQVKPGEDVSLRIKTAPNSFVGLLAVDQSALMLRKNNDFEANDFYWPLSSYNTYTPWQGGYSTYPGETSGVVTFTNADYFYNRTKPTILHRVMYDSAVVQSNVESTSFFSPLSKSDMIPAGAAGLAGGGSVPVLKEGELMIRRNFLETWFFANIENTETEEFTWVNKIPDTITTWVLSAFSLNPVKGIGVLENKQKVVTFQPFFISIRLPYSVKRGEVINVPALVFNYLEKDLDVEITLDNTDGEFEFTEVDNEVINEQKRTKTVRVPANSAKGVSFLLRPKIIGNILLKFTAISPIAGDAIHKTLKVVPEGITEYANRAYFVNLKDTPEHTETFELALPKEVVPDSQHIEFTVVGDLLGPLLNNLNQLVRMPTGCGEQTVSTLVPNYLVLRYLKTINKLTSTLKYKIKSNLESGYQHILSYRHSDGSFSSFGPGTDNKKPRNGSTWLTAYVVRSLQEAKEYIIVDDKPLLKGLSYLASKQAANGSFTESGDYFYASQRNPITLTASVLLTFLENATWATDYKENIEKGLKFIVENVDKSDDLHAKALATYTLHKAKHSLAAQQLSNLKSLVKSEDDRKWWSPNEQKSKIWWRWSYNNEVEITSYILLTLLDTESETVDSVLPIIKWLIAQRNSYGGFASTQDTVLGLKALIKFAEKSGFAPAIMQIDVTPKSDSETKDSIKLNEENGLLLQNIELNPKAKSVNFRAKGTGAALVQIAYQYNVVEKEPQPSFAINTIINKNTPTFKLELDVCIEFVGDGDASNMAVLEVSLPSGYTADVDNFEHIKAVDRVRQTETKNSESVIVVYFESLHKKEVQCLPIVAYKSFAVAMQKPAPIVVYDYYETTRRATDYYLIDSKLCDICEEDGDCKKVCK